MSRSWIMKDPVYVTLESIIWFSSPALICLADQSISELSSDSDLKCSISQLGADKGWPKTTGNYWHGVLLLGPNLIFSSIILIHREKSRKDDWLERCYIIWLGFMSRFLSWHLSHGYHQHLHTLQCVITNNQHICQTWNYNMSTWAGAESKGYMHTRWGTRLCAHPWFFTASLTPSPLPSNHQHLPVGTNKWHVIYCKSARCILEKSVVIAYIGAWVIIQY